MIPHRRNTDNGSLYIDITDSAAVVIRGESWTTRSNGAAGILMGCSHVGDSATVSFNGTRVQAYGEHPNEPHSYSYAVDDGVPAVVNSSGSDLPSNVELLYAWMKDDTPHSLVVTNIKGPLWLAFFVITDLDSPYPATVDRGASASASAPTSFRNVSSALSQHPAPSEVASSDSPSSHQNSKAIVIASLLAVLVGITVLIIAVRLLFRRRLRRDATIAPARGPGANPDKKEKMARMSGALASKDHRLSYDTTASSNVSTLPPYGYTWEPQIERDGDHEDNRPPSYQSSDSDSATVALPSRHSHASPPLNGASS